MTAEKKESEQIEKPIPVADFINDPAAQKVALESAKQIIQFCGVKWFDALEIVAKFGIGLHDSIQKLDALKLFGLIHEKVEPGKEKLYKVTLTNNHRIKLHEMDINFYENKIKAIKKEIDKIKEKIAKAES